MAEVLTSSTANTRGAQRLDNEEMRAKLDKAYSDMRDVFSELCVRATGEDYAYLPDVFAVAYDAEVESAERISRLRLLMQMAEAVNEDLAEIVEEEQPTA